MPRVPLLPGPEETPRPLPGPYQSIPIPAGLGREGARLSRLGAAIDGFGQSAGALLARRAAEMRDEDAAARATQAFAAFKAEAAPLFHDPEQGFFALPGGAAYPQLHPLTRRFTEIEKKHHQGIEDPAERRLYESLAFPWAERMSEAAARKAAQARPLWLDEASTGRLQGALDEAAIAYTDPERIDDLLSSGIAELARMKTRNRWDDARFKETAAGFLTLGHAGVVERMLQAGDLPAARAHYENTMSLLTEEGRRHIEERLGSAETAGKARAEAGDLYARGLERTEALEATQGIHDPVLRERTTGELERLYDRAAGERRRADQARRDAAWEAIEKGGAVLDLAPELRDGLDAETLGSLKAFSRATLTGEPIKTDPAIWSRLKAMDPADLAAEDLRRWRGSLSGEDYRDLIDLSRAAAGGAEADRTQVLQARVLNRAFLDHLRAHGIESASPDAVDLRRRVEDDLALREQSTGRPPVAAEIRYAVGELGGTAGDDRLIGGSAGEEPTQLASAPSPEEKNVATDALRSELVERYEISQEEADAFVRLVDEAGLLSDVGGEAIQIAGLGKELLQNLLQFFLKGGKGGKLPKPHPRPKDKAPRPQVPAVPLPSGDQGPSDPGSDPHDDETASDGIFDALRAGADAFRNWLKPILEPDYKRMNSAARIGEFSETVREFLINQDKDPGDGTILATDQRLRRMINRENKSDEKMIPEDILFNLPETMKEHRAVLWDKEKGNLLYVFDVPGDKTGKYVIAVDVTQSVDQSGKSRDRRGNYLWSASRVPLRALTDTNTYTIVEGRF